MPKLPLKGISEHFGVQHFARGYLGSTLITFWHLSCNQSRPVWGLRLGFRSLSEVFILLRVLTKIEEFSRITNVSVWGFLSHCLSYEPSLRRGRHPVPWLWIKKKICSLTLKCTKLGLSKDFYSDYLQIHCGLTPINHNFQKCPIISVFSSHGNRENRQKASKMNCRRTCRITGMSSMLELLLQPCSAVVKSKLPPSFPH